jgi:hypothetical protein
VLVAGTLLAGIHWTEYWSLKSGLGPFSTGRYLLPIIGLAGLVLATAVRTLRPGHRVFGAAAALTGFLALDLLAFALLTARFYA